MIAAVVVDEDGEDGELLTRMACELEQWRCVQDTRVAGTTKLNTRTGRAFHVARVRNVFGEGTSASRSADQPQVPVPGNVVSGLVYVVASLDALWSAPGPPEAPGPARKRRWFRR